MKFKVLYCLLCIPFLVFSQEEPLSITQKWMDVLLKMIENDGQGPTIQARNLFHTSAAMYDAWAAYDKNENTFFLGKEYHGHHLEFDPEFKTMSSNVDSLRNIAISYAAYNVIQYRYSQYGSKGRTVDIAVNLMEDLQLTVNNRDVDYKSGSPEALGNYIANHIIEIGQQDGSLEEESHQSESYEFINSNLKPGDSGVGVLDDPNKWQPIDVNTYVRKKGLDKTLQDWNLLLVDGNTQFLTFFWGNVLPFALSEKKASVYFDPGAPPFFDPENEVCTSEYQWGFQLVQDWSGYLDPFKNKTIWDVSPKGITSLEGHLPVGFEAYQKYYSKAKNNLPKEHKTNPYTKKPYVKNHTKQGDYCRVIAEFWVDGPTTKSPPGHWLQFLKEVSYQPSFKRKWKGKGDEMSQLAWDTKSNFLLSGTLHDAAIACWDVKSFYNYVRPITAIRYLSSLGQSSDPSLPNFNPNGIKLKKGSVALIQENDPLVGANKEHLNKIKIKAWKGPDFVDDPFEDTAGTDWILGIDWWPYQRYMFATPPFAGYVSGHSTFSIAGAEILNFITGSPYFPEGLKTFTAKKNEFLSFENGPSADVTLQWATYYDAAIETCISRVWGGIHPPADDIEGRRLGQKIALNAIQFSKDIIK